MPGIGKPPHFATSERLLPCAWGVKVSLELTLGLDMGVQVSLELTLGLDSTALGISVGEAASCAAEFDGEMTALMDGARSKVLYVEFNKGDATGRGRRLSLPEASRSTWQLCASACL